MQKTNSFDDVLQAAISEKIKSLKRPTVLICGYTGVGKTTIIQKICGKSIVPDSKISHFAPGTDTFAEYSTEFIRIWDSRGLQPDDKDDDFVNKTKNFVRTKRREKSPDEHIHVVWYCIQGSGARVTPTDEKLISEIFDKKNTMVLITKNDDTKIEQRDSITKHLINKGISKDMIFPVSEDDLESLNKVVRKTIELLPDDYKDAFIAAQILSFKEKEKKAQQIINTTVAIAAVGGATPLPLIDVSIVAFAVGGMISSLSMLYGFDGSLIHKMLDPAINQSLAKQFSTSLIKIIPIVGNSIHATVAADFTRAFGCQVNEYLKKQIINHINEQPMEEFKFEWSVWETIFKKVYKNNSEPNQV